MGVGQWDLFAGLPTLDDLANQPAGRGSLDMAAPADNAKLPEAGMDGGNLPASAPQQVVDVAAPISNDPGAFSPINQSLVAALSSFHPGPGGSGQPGANGVGATATPPPAAPAAAGTLPVQGTGGDSGSLPPPPDGGSHDSDRILESLRVPTETGAGVTSQTVLKAGVTYNLYAWGDFQYGATIADRGDAQYRDFPHATPYSTDTTTPIGLAFAGVTVLGTHPVWGRYRPDHSYTVQVRGQGTALHAYFQDASGAYHNHHGSLSLALGPLSSGNPGAIPPDTPPVQCCGYKGDLSQTAPGDEGGYDAGRGFGDGNIRYFDGMVRLEGDDLSSGGFGTDWGVSRTWANFPTTAWSPTPLLGSGMNDSQQPLIISQPPPDGSSYTSIIIVYTSALNAHYFYGFQDGSFVPFEFEGDRLVLVGGSSPYYDYTDSTGN